MSRSDDVTLSKLLGYVLRHRPDAAGIELTERVPPERLSTEAGAG